MFRKPIFNIYIKMDFALNNLQQFICHKTKPSGYTFIYAGMNISYFWPWIDWTWKYCQTVCLQDTLKNLAIELQLSLIWPSPLRLGEVNEWFMHKIHAATHTYSTHSCRYALTPILIYTYIHSLVNSQPYTYMHTCTYHIYPTPPLGQDMTQGQFLSGV